MDNRDGVHINGRPQKDAPLALGDVLCCGQWIGVLMSAEGASAGFRELIPSVSGAPDVRTQSEHPGARSNKAGARARPKQQPVVVPPPPPLNPGPLLDNQRRRGARSRSTKTIRLGPRPVGTSGAVGRDRVAWRGC